MYRGVSRVLILGDGLLGSEIQKQTGWDLISRRKDGFDINDNNFEKLIGYELILNCIANTDTYSNEKEMHWNTNFKAVYNLIQFCNKEKIKFVHIGTDYLYANNVTKNTKEDEVPVHAENWYSYTKLLGDGIVQLLSDNYLICRCTHKPYPFPYQKAFVDRIGNFDYTHIIAKLIIELINGNATGVFNVGTESKSIYELVMNDFPNVIPISTPDGYPKDTSMSIDKMNSFLYDK
jgi:dTDP-4-dehydrorhamnose reductase